MIPQDKRDANPEISARLGLAAGQPLVVVATSGPGHSVSQRHHQMVAEGVAKLSAAIPNALVVAKLHRKDRIEYYQQMIRRHPESRLQVIANGTPGYPDDIFDWLQGCSLLITGASAVAHEAMFMDVPVVTIDFAGELSGTNFIDAGATTHVRDFVELEQAVRRLIESPDAALAARQRGRGFLEDMYFKLDGRSAEAPPKHCCGSIQESDFARRIAATSFRICVG